MYKMRQEMGVMKFDSTERNCVRDMKIEGIRNLKRIPKADLDLKSMEEEEEEEDDIEYWRFRLNCDQPMTVEVLTTGLRSSNMCLCL